MSYKIKTRLFVLGKLNQQIIDPVAADPTLRHNVEIVIYVSYILPPFVEAEVRWNGVEYVTTGTHS